MKSKSVLTALLLLLLITTLPALTGCDTVVRGGAEVVVEGISIGTLSMEGEPVQGLPSGKVDLVIKASTNKVTISSIADKVIITLSPSNAVITRGPDGLSITGVEPDDIELKWQATE